jgi:hypothetical protein
LPRRVQLWRFAGLKLGDIRVYREFCEPSVERTIDRDFLSELLVRLPLNLAAFLPGLFIAACRWAQRLLVSRGVSMTLLLKGKPTERWGRKVTGLKGSGPMMAGLPECTRVARSANSPLGIPGALLWRLPWGVVAQFNPVFARH